MRSILLVILLLGLVYSSYQSTSESDTSVTEPVAISSVPVTTEAELVTSDAELVTSDAELVTSDAGPTTSDAGPMTSQQPPDAMTTEGSVNATSASPSKSTMQPPHWSTKSTMWIEPTFQTANVDPDLPTAAIEVDESPFEEVTLEVIGATVQNGSSVTGGPDPGVDIILTEKEKDFIVKSLNHLRATIYASNMMKIVWSQELTKPANEWVRQCKFYFGQSDVIGGLENLGQTYFVGNGTDELLVPNALYSWANEYRMYDHQTFTCRDETTQCHNIMQLLSAETKAIGCAKAKCDKSPSDSRWSATMLFTCYYHPGGNLIGIRPYIASLHPCSACPTGRHYCRDGLCDAECGPQNADCICKAKCKNGGVVTPGCSCQCTEDWSGVDCSIPCADFEICDKNDCEDSSFYRELCPKTCDRCGKLVSPNKGLRSMIKNKKTTSCRCLNGGTPIQMDVNKCKCRCRDGFDGAICQNINLPPEQGVFIIVQSNNKATWLSMVVNLKVAVARLVNNYCLQPNKFKFCCPDGDPDADHRFSSYVTAEEIHSGSNYPKSHPSNPKAYVGLVFAVYNENNTLCGGAKSRYFGEEAGNWRSRRASDPFTTIDRSILSSAVRAGGSEIETYIKQTCPRCLYLGTEIGSKPPAYMKRNEDSSAVTLTFDCIFLLFVMIFYLM